MAYDKTTNPTQLPVTHAIFAEFASRLAAVSASWASDSLILPHRRDEPMRAADVARFTAQAESLLGAINGR